MVLKKLLNPYCLKVLLVLLLAMPSMLMAQKLKVNEYDKFIRKRRLETIQESLKSNEDIKMSISLGAVDTSFFIRLAGSGTGTNTVDEGGQLLFLLDNDSSVIAKSPALQTIDYGNMLPTYKHEYIMPFETLEGLSKHNLRSIRKYSIGGSDDITIEKANAAKLRDLCAFFVNELGKVNLIPKRKVLLRPGFPGGNQVFLNFLNRNLSPLPEVKNEDKRNAVLQFQVMADGSVTNIQVTPSAGPSLDNELVRILKRMPKWKPASEDGKAVSYSVSQPVLIYRSGNSLQAQF